MTIGPAGVEEKNVQVRKLRVPAEEGQLSKVRDFIAECCDEAGFSTRETNNTKLAVDEACTNVIKHAYKDTVGDIEIQVTDQAGRRVGHHLRHRTSGSTSPGSRTPISTSTSRPAERAVSGFSSSTA